MTTSSSVSASPSRAFSFEGAGAIALGAVVIALVTVVVYYWPAVHGDFVLDEDLLLNNALVKDLGGLYRIWFTTDAIDYWPVSNSLMWIEWRLWGTNPLGYHLVNLALHVAGALLVWAVLRQLRIPGAFLAGLLFAVHPVNVESVAWISQLKTVLAVDFALLSVLWYLQAGVAPRSPETSSQQNAWGPRYWLSLGAFVLAMLSKGSVATLPLILLTIDWWRHEGLSRRDFLRVAPFVLVSVPLVVANMWFRRYGADEVIRHAGSLERLLGAGAVPWFYLVKALAPFDLSFIYPQWNIQVGIPLWWLTLLMTIAATVLLWRSRDRAWGRALLAAWIVFCLALLPVAGFVDVTYMKWSLVADHYQYLAIVSVLAVVAAAIAESAEARPALAWVTYAGSAALVVGLAYLAWSQGHIYRNAVTVYEATVQQNPDFAMGHNNLGQALNQAGRKQEALAQYQKALELQPDLAEAHYNLATMDFEAHRLEEAVVHFREAVRLAPSNPDFQNNLGVALFRTGQLNEAIVHGREAVRLAPTYTGAHFNLGTMLLANHQGQEAVDQLEEAVRLRPDFSEAHGQLGLALMQVGQPEKAAEHFTQALKLTPTAPSLEFNLSVALLSQNQPAAAIPHLQEAVRQNPADGAAWYNLGAALLNTQHPQEAIDPLERAARLQPDDRDTVYSLARALSESGRAAEAIPKFEKAIQLDPQNPRMLADLADAQSQQQQWAKAAAMVQRAIEVARSRGETSLVGQLEKRLAAYQAAQSASPGTAAPSASESPARPAPSPVLPPSP